jgi:hypothetical protein
VIDLILKCLINVDRIIQNRQLIVFECKWAEFIATIGFGSWVLPTQPFSLREREPDSKSLSLRERDLG